MIITNEALPIYGRKMLLFAVVFSFFALIHETLPAVLREIISWKIMLGHYGAVQDLLAGVEYVSSGRVQYIIYILGILLTSGGGWVFFCKRGIVGWRGVFYSIAISFIMSVVAFFALTFSFAVYFYAAYLIASYFFLSNLFIMLILSIISAHINI